MSSWYRWRLNQVYYDWEYQRALPEHADGECMNYSEQFRMNLLGNKRQTAEREKANLVGVPMLQFRSFRYLNMEGKGGNVNFQSSPVDMQVGWCWMGVDAIGTFIAVMVQIANPGTWRIVCFWTSALLLLGACNDLVNSDGIRRVYSWNAVDVMSLSGWSWFSW